MNMRDMAARKAGKAPKKGLERGHEKSVRHPPDDSGEFEVLDELDEAVHVARGDGHFAPTSGRYQKDDDEHDCPDRPPPGWGDD